MRPTAKQLRQELRYDPDSGEFWWIKPRRKRRLDRQAGSIGTHRSGNQARGIMIDGRRYYANVLAWLLMTGRWPRRTVDHINRDPLDNRWSNLRLATQSQQNMNRRPPRPGLTGASFHRPSGLWQAYIKKGGKMQSLGYFRTAQEAHEAYLKAAVDMFGEFAHTTSR